MGALACFELSPEFVLAFPIFIETGYGTGASLEYAATHEFTRLFSLEIWPASANAGMEKFKDDARVTVVLGHSPDALSNLLRTLHESIFFFLDAHFPGEYHDRPRDECKEPLRLPLKDELQRIRHFKPDGDYTILIDDLRYWGDLPWEQGPPGDDMKTALPELRHLNFLFPFVRTHRVEILLNDKGYALITPLGAPTPRWVRREAG